jgi:hypothetical protein
LGNSIVAGQENSNLLLPFAHSPDPRLTASLVALENRQWVRMLLPLPQSLIEFGGMR